MFSASRRFSENISTDNKNLNTRSQYSNARSLDELNDRLAVRFLVQKSKRFDQLQQQMKHTLQQINLRAETSPECLVYLGLAPRNAKAKVHGKEPMRQEKKKYPEFQFPKPRVFECCYCNKVFFHKLVYRRHMIRHLKKIHWCMKCNRGFTLKISHRRHQLTCRH